MEVSRNNEFSGLNVENTQIPTQFEGSGCYKKSVLQHCNYHGGGSLYDGFYTM